MKSLVCISSLMCCLSGTMLALPVCDGTYKRYSDLDGVAYPHPGSSFPENSFTVWDGRLIDLKIELGPKAVLVNEPLKWTNDTGFEDIEVPFGIDFIFRDDSYLHIPGSFLNFTQTDEGYRVTETLPAALPSKNATLDDINLDQLKQAGVFVRKHRGIYRPVKFVNLTESFESGVDLPAGGNYEYSFEFPDGIVGNLKLSFLVSVTSSDRYKYLKSNFDVYAETALNLTFIAPDGEESEVVVYGDLRKQGRDSRSWNWFYTWGVDELIGKSAAGTWRVKFEPKNHSSWHGRRLLRVNSQLERVPKRPFVCDDEKR